MISRSRPSEAARGLDDSEAMAKPINPDKSVEALVSQANAISVSWEAHACEGVRIKQLIEDSISKSKEEDQPEFCKALQKVEKLFKRECTRVSNFCTTQLERLEKEQKELKDLRDEPIKPTTSIDYRKVEPVPIARMEVVTDAASIGKHASGKRKVRPSTTEKHISKHASGKRRVRSPPAHVKKRQKNGNMQTDTKKTLPQACVIDVESMAAKNRQMQKRWSKLQRNFTMLKMFHTVNLQILSLCSRKVERRGSEIDNKSLREAITKTVSVMQNIIGKQKKVVEDKFTIVNEGMVDAHEFRNLMEEAKETDPGQNDDDEEFKYHYETVPVVRQLDLHTFAAASKNKLRLVMSVNALSEPITIPVLVAKGKYAGKVLCLTSAIHGNELNGIPVIHKLFSEIDVDELGGTIVAFPVLNPSGFLNHTRKFSDGKDLNRYFPGKWNGDCTEAYVYTVLKKIVSHVDYLIDMHTASFGRVNSFYVRANMRDPAARQMALLQNPQFIVHNSSPHGSLRGIAQSQGVPAITVEIGNPQIFHKNFIRYTIEGIENILCHLSMLPDTVEPPTQLPVICNSSCWIFLQHGGILNTFHVVGARVCKGQVIGTIQNIFGDLIHEYTAPYDSVVIGKNVNPVCQVGDRLIHLGTIGTHFRKDAQDGH
mmetsp:Transcript_9434/g.13141  ORF Transcript_9434/g.13141 Transcript_9434/m.13141 type:complete len:654 (+) Transcript_9434:39-2000(+)